MIVCVEWIEQYSESLVPGQILQKAVDDFMNQFDRKKEEVTSLFILIGRPLTLVHLIGLWSLRMCVC